MGIPLVRFGHVNALPDSIGYKGPSSSDDSPMHHYTLQVSGPDRERFDALVYQNKPSERPDTVQFLYDSKNGVTVLKKFEDHFQRFQPVQDKSVLKLLKSLAERLEACDASKDGRQSLFFLIKGMTQTIMNHVDFKEVLEAMFLVVPEKLTIPGVKDPTLVV